MTSVNDLFQWMATHRIPPSECSRCHKERVGYLRDHQEQPVCYGCIGVALNEAEIDGKAIRRRLAQLHDCPAEGCLTCAEAGL